MARAPPQRREIQSPTLPPPVANVFGRRSRDYAETPIATVAAERADPTGPQPRNSCALDRPPGRPALGIRDDVDDAWPDRHDRFLKARLQAKRATIRSASASVPMHR